MPNTLLQPRAQMSLGSLKVVFLTMTGPTSYVNPGGAVDFSAQSLGLAEILFVNTQDPPTGQIVRYDPATGKLKFFWSGTASAVLNEVTNATNLSTVTFRAMVVGY